MVVLQNASDVLVDFKLSPSDIFPARRFVPCILTLLSHSYTQQRQRDWPPPVSQPGATSNLLNICMKYVELLRAECFLVLIFFIMLLISGNACNCGWWLYRCCTTAVMAAGAYNVRTETLPKASAETHENKSFLSHPIHSNAGVHSWTAMARWQPLQHSFLQLFNILWRFSLGSTLNSIC